MLRTQDLDDPVGFADFRPARNSLNLYRLGGVQVSYLVVAELGDEVLEQIVDVKLGEHVLPVADFPPLTNLVELVLLDPLAARAFIILRLLCGEDKRLLVSVSHHRDKFVHEAAADL